MISIEKKDRHLLLIYEPEETDSEWLNLKLGYESANLRRIYTVSIEDIFGNIDTAHDDGETRYIFHLGDMEGEYYKINPTIIGTKHGIYLHVEMPINDKTFRAYRDISIFKHIDELIDQDIRVGGDAPGAIPIEQFERLLRQFPNSTELTHYAKAKITRIIKDYFETAAPADIAFEKYLKTQKLRPKAKIISAQYFREYEAEKYRFIEAQIQKYLEEENSYSENDWQNLILDFIPLIFPKYICALKKVSVKDFYSNELKTINREIDIALIDADGHLDVIEIKKPISDCLVSPRKYRDNYTPRNELAGAVMQVEKYIFHLNKWGVEGERAITKKYQGYLPSDMTIRITNPKAIIIAGRTNNLSESQKFDFEVIKRKYAHIVDIISYDDLLARLSRLIDRFSKSP